uniref:Eukaryotic translation initiation factor 3 subunit I n=1 Tax=Polytomella parva TaxID=51329 RepID=A0A7S0V0Y0_9CHLO|mmetsp:Transcript_27917/g.51590  ORF Transcript_27917/g.51590 Transcript_27917/m.51590 type:complete len:334 (+) Transcript_27917:88-1089(+)|eukprot:CAMPEP_0175057400 /NCGR_PEP_ID=MMETSP0052_2-20121109/11242_1 /TAXON_ID=51329 ORGANISM="Polytomella parva, Strain SAG 63-3" /NCGR_SAMPLE_ID=MMETSP0052_2 /ASSEMBLY_ACC=CAM_ASM_000194 /LENGTH=333 /DNA_ID=CAMNT_0016322607 /DNA_START=82 /DNA_END=1083 /DNA_ORIENTATION=+
MRPFVLNGHERPLTQVKFNREGDLFITCGKNAQPCLWLTETGKRIGTYVGHSGVVWSCDISDESERLYTASADGNLKVWSLPTGKELASITVREPFRAVKLSVGGDMIACSTDSFMDSPARLMIFRLTEDGLPEGGDNAVPIISFEVPRKPGARSTLSRIYWTEENSCLITSHDDGVVRKWNLDSGEIALEVKIHEDSIQDMQISTDATHLITASLDRTSKIIDAETLEVIKVYNAGRPVQSAALSPIFDHVVVAGGQDASKVTTTVASNDEFESRFFHKVFGEEFGRVRGHFGPVNTVSFSPDGKSFVTGGEDGTVRLQHFDNEYFTLVKAV